MKFAIVIISALVLSGCGQIQREKAHWAGYTKVCVDNVTYIQFPTGATVQRDKDDKIVPCS